MRILPSHSDSHMLQGESTDGENFSQIRMAMGLQNTHTLGLVYMVLLSRLLTEATAIPTRIWLC